MQYRYLRNAVLFLALVSTTACSIGRSPITGNKRVYGMNLHEAKVAGDKAAQRLIEDHTMYRGSELTAYVDSVGSELLKKSHLRADSTPAGMRGMQVEFRIIESDVPNALAVPGHIFVTTGILQLLDTEAQLAAILSHEIAHIAARHASQRVGEGRTVGLFAGLASLGAEIFFDAGELGSKITQGTGSLFLRGNSRDDEREADALGIDYLVDAGYDPWEMPRVFAKIDSVKEREGNDIPTFLSTHPDPGDRSKRMQTFARERAPHHPTAVRVFRRRYQRKVSSAQLSADSRFAREATF